MDLHLPITPQPKPTISRQYKYNARSLRYYDYVKELRWVAHQHGYNTVPEELRLTYIIPMPLSWSNKKKKEMNGKIHLQKPDLTNLTKAFEDGLCENDSYIWRHDTRKIWGEKGEIIIHL